MTVSVPSILVGLYLAASVVTFTFYSFDKYAAIKGRWRIRERTLHLMALFFGWPGALAAQRLMRHKISKSSFQRMFWITVVLNCCAVVWFYMGKVHETSPTMW